jgi:hypothetical protein
MQCARPEGVPGERWGPQGWHILDYMAYTIQSHKDAELLEKMLKVMASILPCVHCRNHLKRCWSDEPHLHPDVYATRLQELSYKQLRILGLRMINELHNKVSKDLNTTTESQKQVWSFDVYMDNLNTRFKNKQSARKDVIVSIIHYHSIIAQSMVSSTGCMQPFLDSLTFALSNSSVNIRTPILRRRTNLGRLETDESLALRTIATLTTQPCSPAKLHNGFQPWKTIPAILGLCVSLYLFST